MFSLVSSLPSTDSADGGTPSLFAGFSGTMELSDFPLTCTSVVRRLAFTDRSASMGEAEVAGISWLPRGKFSTMPVVSDSVGGMSDLPIAFDMSFAFPMSEQGRPPQCVIFSELNTRPGCTSVNASSCRLPDSMHHSRPRRLARSYLVRLFHSLPSSGLRQRTLTPFPCPRSEERRVGKECRS